MRGIGKRFGPTTVLSQVDFEGYASEVHVLAGENGAGKSTLIKILGGAFADYEGNLELDGVEVRPRSPREAAALGIAVIHQELSLVPSLGAADNLFLGRWPTDRFGLVRGREQRAAAVRALERFGLDLDPDRPVGELPPAVRQLIEIAKALDRDARVIVMDEPTSALAGPDVEELHGRLDDLKARGCAVVYITHRMEEIERVADRITVLRDGRRIGSAPASEVPAPLLLRWMAGRDAPEPYRRTPPAPALFAGRPERLRVEGITVIERGRKLVDSVSLAARPGEIVGLAGLQGSGASEVLAALFGGLAGRRVYTTPFASHDGGVEDGANRGLVRTLRTAGDDAGTEQGTAMKLRLDGKEMTIRGPRDAIARGIALLTNDRQGTGLVLPLSIAANLSLPDLRRCSPWGLLRPAREETAAAELMRALGIRAASPEVPVRQLSGGNQQKVALGKWLPIEPRLLLLDEPTRGVDVGAKREIYEHLDRFTARGIAIVLASSDLPELLALADRIVVLHRGRVTARLDRGQATPEAVLHAAMGEIVDADPRSVERNDQRAPSVVPPGDPRA